MPDSALAAMLPAEMKTLRWKPLFVFQLAVNAPQMVGQCPGGDRRVGEITGGTFEGERLRGKILSGGSDWQSLRADGVLTLNVRLMMQTDDGAMIGMTYPGMRHGPPEVMAKIARGESVSPNDYYLRALPLFETSAEKYTWLNKLMSVAVGHRLASGPVYQVFEIV